MATADEKPEYVVAARVHDKDFFYVLMSREEFRLLKLDNMGIEWLPHTAVLAPSGDYLVPVGAPHHLKFRPHIVKPS